MKKKKQTAKAHRDASDKKLTYKEQAFVDNYAGNGTKACKLAGYKGNDKVLGIQAVRMLGKARIVDAIKARQEKPRATKIMNREQRQAFWNRFANDKDLEPQHRLRASELLGKSEGDFLDRIKVDLGGELDDFTPEELALIASGMDPNKIIAKRGKK